MTNEPTDNPQIPRTVTALVELLTETAGDPTLAELHSPQAMWMTYAGGFSVTFHWDDRAALMARCLERFGGVIADGTTHSHKDRIDQVLTTEWRGVPLKISVPIARESIETQLRNRIAELESAAAESAQATV